MFMESLLTEFVEFDFFGEISSDYVLHFFTHWRLEGVFVDRIVATDLICNNWFEIIIKLMNKCTFRP